MRHEPDTQELPQLAAAVVVTHERCHPDGTVERAEQVRLEVVHVTDFYVGDKCWKGV